MDLDAEFGGTFLQLPLQLLLRQRPQAADTLARLKAAQEQGQLAPDFDLDLAFELLSGPLYFRLLISHEPLTPAYYDRVLQAVFAGMGPRPQP